MDEQVIQDLYRRATSLGYTKSQDDFVNLLHTDQEVFDDMYSYVQSQGYTKSTDDFATLVGKKKVGGEGFASDGQSTWNPEWAPTQQEQSLESQFETPPPPAIGIERAMTMAQQRGGQPIQPPAGMPQIGPARTARPLPPSIQQPQEQRATQRAIENTPEAKKLLAEYSMSDVAQIIEKPTVEFVNGRPVERGGKYRLNDEFGGLIVSGDEVRGLSSEFTGRQERPAVPMLGDRPFVGDEQMREMAAAKPEEPFTVDDFMKMKDEDVAMLMMEGNPQLIKYVTDLVSIGRQEARGGFDEEAALGQEAVIKQNAAIDRAVEISKVATQQLSAYIPAAKEQLTAQVDNIQSQVNAYRLQLGVMLQGGQITKQQYDEQIAQLDTALDELANDEAVVSLRAADVAFKQLAAMNAWYDAYGDGNSNVMKGLANAMLQGIDSTVKGLAGAAVDIEYVLLSLMNKEYRLITGQNMPGLPDNFHELAFDEEFKSAVRDQVVSFLDPELEKRIGIQTQNEQRFLDSIDSRILKGLYQAGTGLVGSIPAMAIPGGIGFFGFAYDGAYNDAVERGMSSVEASMYASSVGLVVGALEKYGLSNLISNKALVTQLATRSMRQIRGAKGDIIKALDAAVNRTVKGIVPTFGKRVLTGFAAEAETGGLQTIAEGLAKEVTNVIAGREVFTQEDINLSASSILEGAVLEGLGGAYMSTLHAAISGRERHNWSGFSDEQMRLFRDSLRDGSALEEQYLGFLNQQYQKKEITAQEYQRRIVNYNSAKAAIAAIPNEYSDRDAAEAADLIQQRDAIENYKKTATGPDANRYDKQLQRINDRLKEIDDKYETATPGQRPAAPTPPPTQPPATPPTPPTPPTGAAPTPPVAPVEPATPVTPEAAGPEGAGETPIGSTTDAKGRAYQYYENKSDKDGITVTTYTFNRSDKDPDSRNRASTISPEIALGEKYEIPAEEIPEGAKVISVTEIREGEGRAEATVFFEVNGQRTTGEVRLEPKQPVSMGAQAREEVTQPVPSEVAPPAPAMEGAAQVDYDAQIKATKKAAALKSSRKYSDTLEEFDTADGDVFMLSKNEEGWFFESRKGYQSEYFKTRGQAMKALRQTASNIKQERITELEIEKDRATTPDTDAPVPMGAQAGEQLEQPVPAEEEAAPEQVAVEPELTTVTNADELAKMNEEVFGLSPEKARADANIMDIMIGRMAEVDGVSKEDVYKRLRFGKTTKEQLPSTGVQFQIDAWHGSPYQFDKFTTEKIGTGEGAQAFGWGLYFTDLESIARGYAEKLSTQNASTEFLFNEEGEDLLRYDLNTNKDFKSKDEILESYLNELSWRKDFYQTDAEYKSFIDDALDIWSKRNSEVSEFKKTRALYKVSLHKGKTPDQYTFLDWDKRLTDSQRELILSQAKKENLPLEEHTYPSGAKGIILNDKNGNMKAIATNGKQIYEWLYQELSGDKTLKSDKDVSLFLLRAGIDGIRYPAESLARGATSATARGFNYVVFDENAVSIEEVIKFQQDAIAARGAMMMEMDKNAIIYALTDPNVSTPLHELAHVFEHYLTDEQRQQVIDAAGTDGWTTATSEYFARGFEKYLADGEAPSPELRTLFEQFKVWLAEIYDGITGTEIDIELNDAMKAIYASMLGVQPEVQQFAEELSAASPDDVPLEQSSDEQMELVVGAVEQELEEEDKEILEEEAAGRGVSLRELITGYFKGTITDVVQAARTILNRFREQIKKALLAASIAAQITAATSGVEMPSLEDVATFAFRNTPTAVVKAISDSGLLGDYQYAFDYMATKNGHEIIKEEQVDVELLVEEELAAMQEAYEKAQDERDAVVANREANTYSTYKTTAGNTLVYANQYPAAVGANYILLPNKEGRAEQGTTSVSGVKGVAHFLLDYDPTTGKSHPNNRRMHEVGRSRDYYVPVYRDNGDGTVTVTYKRYSEIASGDVMMSPLRQFNFADIDFTKTQPAKGFKNAKEVVLREGVTNPYTGGKGTYLIYTGSPNSYGPFSGGSAVFIFTDKNGEVFVRDFSGSVAQMQEEGNKIAQQFGINLSDITIGYHDVGSFSRKPSANAQGTLDTKQIDGMNPDGVTGGALLIPEQGTKRENDQPIQPEPEMEGPPTPQDALLNLLNRLIDATSAKGRAFDASLGIPLIALNNSLKIIRAAYKAGKSLSAAIKEGAKSLRAQGHKVNNKAYEQWVVENMTGKKGEKAAQKQAKEKPTPKETKQAKQMKVDARNYRSLYKVFRQMYGLSRPRAAAAAILGDRLIASMAKRNKISKQQMYERISFTNAEQARDAVTITSDGLAIINALSTSNTGKPLADLAKVFEHYLTDAERRLVTKWAGQQEWNDKVSEKFSNGFMRFLADGRAPSATLKQIFEQFRGWLTMAYNGIVGSQIDLELNNEMRDIYAKMLGEKYDLKTQADIAVMGTAPSLFDETGALIDPKLFGEIRDKFWRDIRNLRLTKAFKTLREVMTPILTKDTPPGQMVNWVTRQIGQLNTLTMLMDGNAGTFFYDNIYRPLARATEAQRMGKKEQSQKLDDIAKKAGIKGGFRGVLKELGRAPVQLTKLGKAFSSSKYGSWDSLFTYDRMMFVYVLSKNKEQRARLAKMGIGEAALAEIEGLLGEKLTKFGDGVVEHLSTEYYDSVNKVYKEVNGEDLEKIENYFPVMTLTFSEDKQVINPEISFEQTFNSEWQSALKSRKNKDGDINLAMNFSTMLVTHLDEMEHFKAYAKLIPDLNAVLAAKSTNVLMTGLGIRELVRESVLSEINPNTIVPKIPTGTDKLWNNYILFTLGNKVVQLPRQATSFTAAFAGYDGNLAQFLKDYFSVVVRFPAAMKEFREISALYDDRVINNFGGDVHRLATGRQRQMNRSLAESRWWLARAIKRVGLPAISFFTAIGDSLGVGGYMARYYRDIKNGMSREEALERFNEYDASQQPTANVNRTPMQRNDKSGMARFVAPFTSAVFALMNMGYQGASGMWNSYRKGTPWSKILTSNDARKFFIGLIGSNVLFTLVNEFSKLAFGDEDDREDALWEIGEALLGLNMLERLPLIGTATMEFFLFVETALGRTPPKNPFRRSTLNPTEEVIRSIAWAIADNDITKFLTQLIGAASGFNIDPVLGLYLFFTNSDFTVGAKDKTLVNPFGFDFDEDAFYQSIGLSKSYRPSKKKIEGMSPSQMEEYFGGSYDDMKIDKRDFMNPF